MISYLAPGTDGFTPNAPFSLYEADSVPERMEDEDKEEESAYQHKPSEQTALWFFVLRR